MGYTQINGGRYYGKIPASVYRRYGNEPLDKEVVMAGPLGDTAKKTSEIQNQKDQLDNAVEDLHGALVNLEGRLCDSLTPAPGAVPEEVEKDRESTVPLADFLRAQVKRIRHVTDTVRELVDRCEL